MVLLFCSMTAVPGAGLQTPGLHLISWRSAPGCWGHYGHWCSLLAAGAFGQTDKQETIFYRSRDYCYIFPSSVSISLFKAFLLILEHATKWSRQVKTNVWRQEGILYWTNGHPAFCHVAAARGPSPALEMLPVQRARPGGWRPGEKQDIVFHNYFMQVPASNQQPATDSGDRGLWSEVGKMKRKNNGTQKRKLNHRLNVNDIVIGMLRPIESILAELPCTSCRLHNGQNILECYEGAV